MVILLACEDETYWRSLAADQPLFRTSILVNLANKQHWYWEQRMIKLIVN